jgi:hypothetical protein
MRLFIPTKANLIVKYRQFTDHSWKRSWILRDGTDWGVEVRIPLPRPGQSTRFVPTRRLWRVGRYGREGKKSKKFGLQSRKPAAVLVDFALSGDAKK